MRFCWHKYKEWIIERRDMYELSDGSLIPFILQRRQCQKCKFSDFDFRFIPFNPASQSDTIE
jgi:hypothetical protein